MYLKIIYRSRLRWIDYRQDFILGVVKIGINASSILFFKKGFPKFTIFNRISFYGRAVGAINVK